MIQILAAALVLTLTLDGRDAAFIEAAVYTAMRVRYKSIVD